MAAAPAWLSPARLGAAESGGARPGSAGRGRHRGAAPQKGLLPQARPQRPPSARLGAARLGTEPAGCRWTRPRAALVPLCPLCPQRSARIPPHALRSTEAMQRFLLPMGKLRQGALAGGSPRCWWPYVCHGQQCLDTALGRSSDQPPCFVPCAEPASAALISRIPRLPSSTPKMGAGGPGAPDAWRSMAPQEAMECCSVQQPKGTAVRHSTAPAFLLYLYPTHTHPILSLFPAAKFNIRAPLHASYGHPTSTE